MTSIIYLVVFQSSLQHWASCITSAWTWRYESNFGLRQNANAKLKSL